MADHVAVARRRREDVEARGAWWRCRRATGALCATAEESAGEDGEGLPFRRHPGGRFRRILDRSHATERRDRKPRRRSGLDRDITSATASEDRQDRRRGVGSRAAGIQAGRTWGVGDGESADPRGRGPPPSLSRAQGPDRRAGPARQSRQGGAVLTRDIWLQAATPRPAGAAGYAPDRRWSPTTGSFEGAGSPWTPPSASVARTD